MAQHDDLSTIRQDVSDIKVIVAKHAQVIDLVIAEREERAEFWRDVRRQVISNSVRGILLALVGVAWYAYTQFTRSHLA